MRFYKNIFVLFGVLFTSQICFGYTGGPQNGIDVGINARATSRMNFQVGTGSTFVMRYGTTTVTGSGTAGYMMGTDTAYPRWVWTPATGRMNFLDITLQQNGVDIAAYGNSVALASALSDETGTNTVVYSSGSTQANPTFTGSSNFPSGIWNSSGNVGIGTPTPSAKLNVQMSSEDWNNGIKLSDNSGDAWEWIMSGNDLTLGYNGATRIFHESGGGLGIGVGVIANMLDVEGSVAIGASYSGSTAAPTNGLIVEGNVGIGTLAPDSKLDVDAGARASQVSGQKIRTSSGTGADGDELFLQFYQQATGVSRAAARIGSVITSAAGFNAGLNFYTTNGGTTAEKMRIDNSGNVGIGVTTFSNILTLPIASVTDPIADAWTLHCLTDYKNIGTETVEMIQVSANDIVKNTPVSVFTKKAIITDKEAEREPKQKYLSEMNVAYKADMEVFGSSTAVAMQDTSYITELLDSMWETKADKSTIVETNKQRLIAEKKALPKFQRKNYGIVAEDAPPEAQVLREDGSLQGVDPSVLVGILWANAQSQEIRISALESETDNLYIIIEVLAGLLGIGGSATWLVQRRKRNS